MALGSIASAPGPNQTASLASNNIFDNSGFVVSVGGGPATSTNNGNKSTTPGVIPGAAQAVRAVGASVGGLLGNPAFVVLVGVALYVYLKRKG